MLKAAVLLGLLALSAPALAAPKPALTPEQADALAGVWVLESGDRLYGVVYDELLVAAAAANGTIDPQAVLDEALDKKPGPTIKVVIPAVDQQSGTFVAYRMPTQPDEHIPPLLRIVGIASADGTSPTSRLILKGIENDEAGWDEAVVEGKTMQLLHFDPQDTFNGTEVVNPSGLMTRVLVKDDKANVEEELRAIAAMLPLGPVANAGGNVAEADSVVAPQGIPAAVTSGAASVGPRVLGLLAGATLTLALLA